VTAFTFDPTPDQPYTVHVNNAYPNHDDAETSVSVLVNKPFYFNRSNLAASGNDVLQLLSKQNADAQLLFGLNSAALNAATAWNAFGVGTGSGLGSLQQSI
jgi:hypothetical protein